MHGTVLAFDAATDEGLLLDAQGARLKFARSDWRGAGVPRAGFSVDFEPLDGRAAEVFLLPGGDAGAGARAMAFGVLSLACALLSLAIGSAGLLTLLLAATFGAIGIRSGRHLPDRTGYRLSVAGVAVSAVTLALILVLIGAFSRLASDRGPPGGTVSVKVETPRLSSETENAQRPAASDGGDKPADAQ